MGPTEFFKRPKDTNNELPPRKSSLSISAPYPSNTSSGPNITSPTRPNYYAVQPCLTSSSTLSTSTSAQTASQRSPIANSDPGPQIFDFQEYIQRPSREHDWPLPPEGLPSPAPERLASRHLDSKVIEDSLAFDRKTTFTSADGREVSEFSGKVSRAFEERAERLNEKDNPIGVRGGRAGGFGRKR